MLLWYTGDVLKADEPKHILVHGCNAQGVMGAGIAKQIRLTYPSVYENYVDLYQERGLRLGQVQIVSVKNDNFNKNCYAVINAITQAKTGPGLQLSYLALERCVEKVFYVANKHSITEIVSPMIGGGLAGGDLKKITKILEDGTKRHPKINWTVYLL